MREFTDDRNHDWIAEAVEEDTPRHHGRWYLVFHPAGRPTPLLPVPEVRWQTRDSAARTLDAMSLFELRRRLDAIQRRTGLPAPDGVSGIPWIARTIDAG